MSQVDVVVPCYNYARFLPTAVGSILVQEGVDVRVLVLDDGSTDDSEAVGRRLAASDPRIEYRRHATNWGHIATYREGIDWLAGDYCLLLAADDMLFPGALARAAAVMDRQPEVGLTHGLTVAASEPPADPAAVAASGTVTITPGVDFVRERCEWRGRFVETPTAIGRTLVQKQIGYYRPELPHTADMDIWLRYAAVSAVARIDAYQAFYRRHGRNMSVGFLGVRDLAQMKLCFDLFFDGPGRDLPGAVAMRRAANRGLADEAFGGAYQAANAGDNRTAADFAALAHAAHPAGRFAPRWARLRCRRLLGRKVSNTMRRVLGGSALTPQTGGA